MFRIVLKDAAVIERSGTKNGRDWHMRSQTGWVSIPSKPFPVEITFTLADKQPPFPVGEYVLDASSAWVSKYGDLRLDVTKMKAAVPQQQRQAG